MAASGTDASFSPEVEAALEAVRQEPENPRLHFELGELYLKHRRFQLAADAFTVTAKLAPQVAAAHFNLGVARYAAEDYAGAVDAYRAALQVREEPDSWNNLGIVYATQGNLQAAQEAFESAIGLEPRFVSAYLNLGRVYGRMKQGALALNAFKQASRLEPNNWRVYFNIAEFQVQLHEFGLALEAINSAIKLAPEIAALYATQGDILKRLGKITDAVASYVLALKYDPGNPLVYNNLGEANRARGQLSEAFFCYLEALRSNPKLSDVHSNWLLTMLYDDRADPFVLLQEARRWEQTHSLSRAMGAIVDQSVPSGQAQGTIAENPSTTRSQRIRVGFVSADLCAHPVGHFLLPIVRHHDRQKFETYLYFNGEAKDQVSEELQSLAGHWQDVVNLSNEDLYRQIKSDGIDILIDLSGHTGGHRLKVFSMRAAPVQLTWAAFPGTTGISQMDYIIGDATTLPSDSAEAYAESFLRLPHSYLCFERPKEVLTTGELPYDRNGFLTFGSCNNYSKVTPGVLRVWAEILLSIPTSRLLLRSPVLQDQGVAKIAREFLAKNGVSADRLELLGRGSRKEFLETYQQIDIALDPFPYGGGITSLEALWMGVPVLCLRGNRFAGLATPSFLNTLGMNSWIAESPEAYVQLANDFAADIDGLRRLHHTLRERMENSPLCDTVMFARNFEQAIYSALERSPLRSSNVRS